MVRSKATSLAEPVSRRRLNSTFQPVPLWMPLAWTSALSPEGVMSTCPGMNMPSGMVETSKVSQSTASASDMYMNLGSAGEAPCFQT